MDNNILELILKLMSGNLGPSNQAQNQQYQKFNTSYPQDGFSETQSPNNYQTQSILPLLMSLLNKQPSVKTADNKKAEESSAPNDEILL